MEEMWKLAARNMRIESNSKYSRKNSMGLKSHSLALIYSQLAPNQSLDDSMHFSNFHDWGA
jgi:hypothetical protein